jgi:dihydroflavonol-4-reductase
MDKTAFVTGATGFVGLNLVKHLTESGWRVTALHRPTSKLAYLRRFPVELVEGDLVDAESVRRAMPRHADAVFHVASDLSFWSVNDARQEKANVEGTRNVLDAARERGAGRVVYTSTLGTYGPSKDVMTEKSPQLAGDSPIHYSRTKWLAEEEVRRAARGGLDALILNPGGILGPYDTNTWGAIFFLVKGDLLPYVPDTGLMSWCHVADVVRAHETAALGGRAGESYILGGEEAEFWTVLEVMAELLGKPLSAHRVPTSLLLEYARAEAALAAHTGKQPLYTPEFVSVFAETYRCSSEKAKRELGYRETPLRTMLEDCHAWLKGEGLLG